MKAKSCGPASYKVSFLDWNLGQQKKSVKFNILQDSNQWVAIGLVHRNVVEAKGMQFTYNFIGHGAYMISSNGSTWSHIKT